MKIRKYLNLLVYLSFVFLVYYLFKIDFLQLKDIQINWFYTIIACCLLFLGFILSGLSWWNALSKHNIKITQKFGIITHGLPVFTKYIPGKIWTIIGRAGYVAKKKKIPLTATSYISLKEQLIYMWVGLLISIVPIVIYFGIGKITLLLTIVFLSISAFLFIKKIHDTLINLLGRLFKKELDIPFITWKEFVSIQFYCFLYWIIWMAGYYFLVKTIIPNTSLSIIFIFPLSVVIGLLAIIIPGGIGIREGLMIAYFTVFGISAETSAMVALAARIWFISGEVFIFLFAIVAYKKDINKQSV